MPRPGAGVSHKLQLLLDLETSQGHLVTSLCWGRGHYLSSGHACPAGDSASCSGASVGWAKPSLGLMTTMFIRSVPAQLCPLGECLLSPYCCQALYWARGYSTEGGGCGLYPKDPPSSLHVATELALLWTRRNSSLCQAQSWG